MKQKLRKMYVRPQQEVVELRGKSLLLAGSQGQESVQGTSRMNKMSIEDLD